MDPIRNPFLPGAGSNPPKLAGRADLLERTAVILERVAIGKGSKSFIVVGLRGVGKTVLLNQAYEHATKLDFEAVQIEANEGRSLPGLLIPKLRQILLRLDRSKQATEFAKRGLRVLAAFANSVRAKVGEVEFNLAIAPEIGTADSGDLEIDLPDLLEVVGRAAQAKSTAIALVVDELQYLSEVEMSAIIMALHRISQRNLPLILIGGGLPQLVGLAGRSKSYAERLFDFPEIGALERNDAYEALIEPIRQEGADITEAAVEHIYDVTQGYPYFIQTWGHHAWNFTDGPTIEIEDMKSTDQAAILSLDESFFRVRFDRLTMAEKNYLFSMAELGPGPHRSGDIAAQLDRKVESVAPTRSSLIKKGMVYSPSHGDTAFTVPMFDEFLQRSRG